MDVSEAGEMCATVLDAVGETVIAVRLSSTAFDLDRLSHEIRRLDESVTDGGSSVDVDEEVSD